MNSPDDFNPAEWKSIAAALGVDVETTVDTFGRTDIRLDRTAMRAFRDAALAHGFTDLASVFSRALAGDGRKP